MTQLFRGAAIDMGEKGGCRLVQILPKIVFFLFPYETVVQVELHIFKQLGTSIA